MITQSVNEKEHALPVYRLFGIILLLSFELGLNIIIGFNYDGLALEISDFMHIVAAMAVMFPLIALKAVADKDKGGQSDVSAIKIIPSLLLTICLGLLLWLSLHTSQVPTRLLG
jgi:hypothetical protein